MKVKFRFPALSLWDEYNPVSYTARNDYEMLKLVNKRYPEKCKEIAEYLIHVCGRPPEGELQVTREYRNDRIMCTVIFDLPEQEGLLFKLKFGESFNEG